MRTNPLSLAILCSGILGGSVLGLAQLSLAECPASIDIHGDDPVQPVTLPPIQPCTIRISHGLPIPDPACTPGAVNPTLTVEVLFDPAFRTRCIRNRDTTPHQKAKIYGWYAIVHPGNNTGPTQSCELDHLVSLELGGADSLDNIWPECGPDGVALHERYFKQKDLVESYLHAQVRDHKMALTDAQRGIAIDWTQFLDAAKAFCATDPSC